MSRLHPSVIRVRFILTIMIASIVASACASSGTQSRRTSSDVITREEVVAASAVNAYELIQQLRPQFLRPRGAVSVSDSRASYPVVYLNDVRYGDIEQLRSIDVRTIVEIRYLNAQDATTRWGTGHVGGAIMVRAEYR